MTDRNKQKKFYFLLKSLAIVVASLVALWEFIQLFVSYDIPQVIVIMPIIGLLTALIVGKYFFIPTVLGLIMSAAYLNFEKEPQFIANNASDISTFLNLGIIIVVFTFIGAVGGLILRKAVKGLDTKVLRPILAVVGIALAIAPGIVFYRNPLYPIFPRTSISEAAKQFEKTDYKIVKTTILYNFDSLEYEARVVMVDGVIYPLYYNSSDRKWSVK